MHKYLASLSPRFSIDVLIEGEFVNLIIYCHDQQLISFYVDQISEYYRYEKDLYLYKRNRSTYFDFSFHDLQITVKPTEIPRVTTLSLITPDMKIYMTMPRGRVIKFLENYIRVNKRNVNRRMIHLPPKSLRYYKDFPLNKDIVEQLSEKLLPHFQAEKTPTGINVTCNGDLFIADLQLNNKEKSK